MNELLPIGSIIRLNNQKDYMIIGFCPSTLHSDVIYDYIVCNPSGISKKKEDMTEGTDFFFIKKEDIENVLFIGFQDQEFDIYKDIITNIVDKLKENQKTKQKLTNDDVKLLCSNILSEMNRREVKNEK